VRPIVELTDGIVSLRPVDERDVDAIWEACADERLQRYIPLPQPYTRDEAEAYVARSTEHWATGRKAPFTVTPAGLPDELLGVISITFAGSTGNAGYWVAPGARGRGVARRALSLLVDWAFAEREVGIVLLEIHEANEASAEVARAVGFRQVGKIEVGTGHKRREALLWARMVTDPS
jgi:RimJ/RimL family protein N-acetyltransferase